MEQSKRPSKINIVVVDPEYQFDRAVVSECLVPWTVETRIENENGADRNHLRNLIRKQVSPLTCYVKAGRTFDNADLFHNLEAAIIDNNLEFTIIKISNSEFVTHKACYDYFNFMAESHVRSIMDVVGTDGVLDLCNLK